ncbi:MAG: SDR family NAD(P)-dependent oxidoreductase [Clostridia bacterium]|nr:SDR family NAD(P)-dependent oxidoreductase [Clostridia bacterium]
MKEAIISSILKKIKTGSLSKEVGVDLCYEIKNMNEGTGAQINRPADIAIIGLAGCYPQARNIYDFWKNLTGGKDCISEIPSNRWRWQDYFLPDRQSAAALGKSYSKWGGFIEDVDKFDPLFFNVAPSEAELMDPQERLFLKVVWEVLEDAGYNKSTLSTQKDNGENNKIGVFVGATWQEYQLYSSSVDDCYKTVVSTNACSIANRVSYFFDFKGYSLTVDTACSSSLMAIHLACDSLLQGTNSIAIAGGVNLTLHPNKYLLLSKHQFASSDGRCVSFGEGGNGYVPGEGVGAVLLKPLSRAITDGDHIYGVIKASAANHGGKTNGFSVPNPNAQAEVITEALEKAGIDPRTISYIEAHGTGTSLGDPIEIAGLNKAFREYTRDKGFCSIGSVKSNIGHCESAAGIAGLTKVLLQLKYRKLVPSLHSRVLNPEIDFDDSPFFVQQELAEWKRPKIEINGQTKEYPKRAGLSSFGAGGVNVHLVIEEYIPEHRESTHKVQNPEHPAIILLSARNQEGLVAQVKQLLDAILDKRIVEDELKQMAYTLQVGREALGERLAVVVSSLGELAEKLQAFLKGQKNLAGLYHGQAQNRQEALFPLTTDADSTVSKLIYDKRYNELLDLWIKGQPVDWNLLYDESKPRRMSLPTYPFAGKSYWVPKIEPNSSAAVIKSPDTFSSRVSPETSGESMVGTVMLVPVWDAFNVQRVQEYPSSAEQILIIGGADDKRSSIRKKYPNAHMPDIQPVDNIDAIAEKLKTYEYIDHIIWIAPDNSLTSLVEDGLIEGQNQGVLQIFRMIKALLQLGYGTRNLGWTIITVQTQTVRKHEKANPTHASLHGLIGSMAKEYRNWKVRLVDMEEDSFADTSRLTTEVFSLPPDPQGNILAYRDGEWYRQQLVPFNRPSLPEPQLYRTGGVYVVIGGAGGIGEVWSEYMIRSFKAQIIWIGRRQTSEAIQAKLDRLATMGPVPEYISADATDEKMLRKAYEKIKQKYTNINGVIHSAIVLLDQSLANMDEERFKTGLSAKIDVSVRMAQVFQKEPLDFVMFFSSMIAFSKFPGQSNYASGCTFKDAYAQQLSREWPCKVKVMDWGYWGSVGIVASKDYQDRMALAGIGSIEPPEAMEALETLLAGPMDQLALMKTTKPLEMEEINPQEVVAVYSENLHSGIQNIESYLPEQFLRINHLKSEVSLHLKEMEGLLCKLLLGQLQSIGMFAPDNSIIGDYKNKTGLSGLYDRWMEESIAALERNKYLQHKERLFAVTNVIPSDMNDLWEEWNQKKSIWMENSNMKSLVVLVDTTLRALPEILTGKTLATEIMFPNSSMELIEGVYKNNMLADYFNEVLADSVVAYIHERLKQDTSAKVRILEIGAGTGGSSKMVFQKLKPYQQHIQEYCYTDISKAFLLFAEKEYGPENPYLTYRIFNAEAPVAGQGVNAGGYDIAIATNVLHATKNIRTTLRNAKAALQKNGLIMLNEMSHNTMFFHLTFGLLEGWWMYEDSALRIPGCPGLYPETWKSVLETEGFNSVLFPVREAHEFGQQIIIAESDGVIRQQQKIKTDVSTAKEKKSLQGNQSSSPGNASKKAGPETSRPVSPNKGNAANDLVLEDFVKELIKEKISESLKIDIDEIGVDEPFADYGLDSITGVNLVFIINQALEIDLKVTTLFDYSSVNQLAAYILSGNKEAIAGIYGLNTNQTEVDEEQDTDSQEESLEILGIKAETGSGSQQISKEPIAIIGMSGRYAKAKSLEELWDCLENGTDLVGEITRWELGKYHPEGQSYCNHGGLLDDIDKFDPLFFNISGIEATYMDPQQRFFLEESWKALEDAGYAGSELGGKQCGVYVGYNGGDYQQLFADNPNPPPQAMWGNSGNIVPARIAYYLDLHGPTVAVDTACSSSLVAIHLACQGLWTNETEMALAGGVFILSTPGFYIYANRASMLSPSGRCYTFDDRADGFVPGEGVGAVVLKRLKDAIADGDHIYGVIRGSGINQDGKTNGITAPSANSQERLERYVYDTFGINPAGIQMVEAHGTGTKLGDPIEFDALTRAFRNYTDKKQYCALGSIKTNIGHSSAAAGVGGLIKILLSLYYKKIPPSINFHSGNSNINFSDSPFYVNTTLRDWEVESEGSPNQTKRCAVISSFGYSGTNAHLAIEEAPEVKRTHPEKPGYLIALSANSLKQLQQQAEKLAGYCSQRPSVDCGNMSFTLLQGRKHMNHRLACVVRNTQELVKFLKKWLEKGKVSQVYSSEFHEKEHREQLTLKQYGNQLLQKCRETSNTNEYLEQLSTVAELYAQGYNLEFRQLFAENQYSRISLPTYPFAVESYWVSASDNRSARVMEETRKAAAIHPLLHQNTSDLSEQRFSSTFNGEEFFLANHRVNGQRILPGVAYLEMARAAVSQAAGTSAGNRISVRLKNVVWARPVIVGEQPANVHIGLFPDDNGDISYEIYSQQGGDNTEPLVHSQGTAVITPNTEEARLDLNAIKACCNLNTVPASQCYKVFEAMGFDYGPGHQGIEQLYMGQGQLLAKLSLPSSVAGTSELFVLHPSLMDSALQATLGLMMDTGDLLSGNIAFTKPYLPFALQEVEIFGGSTASMWALIKSSESSSAGDKVRKLDIDLCDDEGRVCVRMKGFSTRVLEGGAGSAETSAGTLMMSPCWKVQPISGEVHAPDYEKHIVMICKALAMAQDNIKAGMTGVHCILLEAESEDMDVQFQTYAARVFDEIKTILKSKPVGQILVQIVVSAEDKQQIFSGLNGLLKTAHLENPKLIGQLIEINPDEASEKIIGILWENSRIPTESHIRYQDSVRYVAGWSELANNKEIRKLPWKEQGVYLITGGAGGLGLIFAEEMVRQIKDLTVILVGRSELDRNKQAKLKELEIKGARVVYRAVDVADMQAVVGLIQGIKAEFGNLNGIIHSAGVIRDNFIIRKSREELREVMNPKVAGLVNLDQASQDIDLDFFIIFSAGAGIMGNPGQADYASANAFMDNYARYRSTLTGLKLRQGQTLSINWPLWKDGGMRVDEETEKNWLSMGIVPMPAEKGINALYQALASGNNQVMVAEGNLGRLRQIIMGQLTGMETVKKPAEKAKEKTESAVKQDFLQEKAVNYFKKMLSSTTGIPLNRIEADDPMEDYGIDSIMIMQITNQLEEIFGSLPKTLFFEYQNIYELTLYFVDSYKDRLIQLLGLEEKANAADEKPQALAVVKEHEISAIKSRRRSRFAAKQTESLKENSTDNTEIAIIGVAGRYPKARNIHEFWENLQGGKDCITEIPIDRWDCDLYYDEDRNKSGKIYSKWGGFLDGVDEFDPLFFNISPREAEIMDPQERLFMQCVYETLEDAGYVRESNSTQNGFGLEGNVGVYVGVWYEEYQLYGAQEQLRGRHITLAGSPASIANRVSYFFNFHGPSMAVDTMCSSSLTAIHLACKSLQRGECELVVAGGVNVSVHPNKFFMLSQGNFASSRGRCQSFGQGGDGYVPGEGIGAVLLKPLKKAVADGDQIYGVIKGTAINHGGKTNGYTVPNPKAQSEVIGSALREAGIHPRTVSYIEAHGTGTSLGDPIEIAGLAKAFNEHTGDKGFCAIGSAKSNIGHCESAAGIAGITKVLLQFKHKQLVPSLHSKVLNPNIDFINTPFVVQQKLAEWKRPLVEINGETKEYPRIAGISSFGAGGANAHVIIEEYDSWDSERSHVVISAQNPAIIVISAKNEERLQDQVKQLLEMIRKKRLPDDRLADFAYTLQVGREAMEERLGLVVESVNELEEKLKRFSEGQDGIDDLYRGQVKRNKEALNVFAMDEELQEALRKWIQNRKYAKLLDLWVKGLSFDWNQIYGSIKPNRISMPTYPFARERYWVPELKNNSGILREDSAITVLHPLLHKNTSDLLEYRFSSTFTGEEFFLKDYSLKGRKVLSAVAYLEMARAALEQLTGRLEEAKRGITLKNVVCSQPVILGQQPADIHIGLYPGNDGEIAYEIYVEGTDNREPVIYSQGNALLTQIEDFLPLDIKAIRADYSSKTLGSAEIYEVLSGLGSEYGECYRAIKEIHVGGSQLLAKLSLSESLSLPGNRLVIHPCIIDAALQASIGFAIGSGEPISSRLNPAFSFELEEIEVMGLCSSSMWALLRTGEAGKTAKQRLDIDIFDEVGNPCIRIKGCSLTPLESETILAEAPSEDSTGIGTLMLEPDWKESTAKVGTPQEYEQHLVILCDQASEIEIKGLAAVSRCIRIQTVQHEPHRIFQACAVKVFEEIQNILKGKPVGKVLIQIVISSSEQSQVFYGLSGLLKTAQLENPKIVGQLIEIEPGEAAGETIAKLKENSLYPMEDHIRYHQGKRKVAGWSEIETSREEAYLPWKDGGIYLITGGAGGLGLIFAEEIAEKAKEVTLVLTGRSQLSDAKQVRIKALTARGARVIYKQVDVTDREEVDSLIRSIREEFGYLNGVVHSAGIIKDNFIIKKAREEFLEVLMPKVAGLVNLDEATKDHNMDLFVLFSSGAAAMGNPGQADYSTANAFMDSYARYRNNLVALKQRYGRTLSVNWPLWKAGGMKVDKENQKVMLQSGIIPMRTATGIQAFYEALSSDRSQVIILEGYLSEIRKRLFRAQAKEQLYQAQKSLSFAELGRVNEKTVQQLKVILGDIIKLPVSRIDSNEPLESYGIDSVMIIRLNQKLESVFGELSKTLFYEYRTLAELAAYLSAEFSEACLKWTGLDKQAPAVEAAASAENQVYTGLPVLKSLRTGKQQVKKYGTSDSRSDREPIAIVGVSGHFPQANNMQEYWQNLQRGRSCITEIPAKRWPMEGFYQPDVKEAVAQGLSYSKWGGFVEGFAEFDPLFFNISPRETQIIDPQERLFIESCWEVLEDAGYTREQLSKQYNGRVGVFAGITKTGFDLYGADLCKQGENMLPHTSFSSVANRISYLLDLKGPSMPVDTMCSSSLTAIHEACEHILLGECDLAIAGGVNLYLHPSSYIKLCGAQMLSASGACKSFGKGGDGFVPGEGVGCVLLKRLSQAVKDRDHIYAVIKGSNINHGGKTNGYTVPNPNAQAELISRALEKSGVNARTVSYIEAHGTGTELGDPIEITGLSQAFRKDTDDTGYCSIGSVKSNIGHLEAAAGIAGLIKVVLQMKHQKLVPSLHARELNPNINFTKTPFVLQHELTEWKRPVIDTNQGKREYPRVAGISSFGAGGANAHLVIEEYIPHDSGQSLHRITPENPAVIVLSARNEDRLKEQVRRLLAAIGEQQLSDAQLSDIAYTLQVGREAMEVRLAVIAVSITELAGKLAGFIENRDCIDDLFYDNARKSKETLSVFAGDDALVKIVDYWITDRKYSKLAELWVKGINFDWNRIYGEIKPKRISLPTYPFERKVYWLQSRDNKTAANAISAAADIKRKICYFTKQWEPCISEKKDDFDGSIIILSSQESRGLADRLAKLFSDARVLDVCDLGLQLNQTYVKWDKCGAVIDLTGCGKNKELEFNDWILWLQQLIEHRNGNGLKLLCITKGLEAFENTDVNLAGALRTGLYRMLSKEYSRLQSRHIDAESTIDDMDLAKLITDELSVNTDEAEICYRMGKRYKACLKEYHENEEVQGINRTDTMPENHVLLVTGGTRGVGYLCAEYFVKHKGVRRLVLTGKTELPPRQEWDSYICEHGLTARKIRDIKALESLGAKVQVLSLDLTDEAAVKQSIKDIKKTMGPIGGVIHCAGIIDNENPAFIRKPIDGIRKVLAPKVDGLDILYSCLEEEPVDFFALFSSVSAVIPALAAGQSDYAMANAYMDYFAGEKKCKPHIVSIQWPLWKETGMGQGVESKPYKQAGLLSLTNAEGLHMLDHILSRRIGPTVLPAVIIEELWERRGITEGKFEKSFDISPKRADIPCQVSISDSFNDQESTDNAMQKWLALLISQELHIDPSSLDLDTPFHEYGMDSILLAQVIRKMEQKLDNKAIEPSALLEFPTIRELARFFAKTYPEAFTASVDVPLRKEGKAPETFDMQIPLTRMKAEEMPGETRESDYGKVAVIGIACHFPQAADISEYWENLRSAKNCITEVPKSRWDWEKYYEPQGYKVGKSISNRGGFISGIEDFDPKFFKIPEALAPQIDPLQRQWLEVSSEALADAGYSKEDLWGKQVGVFAGSRVGSFAGKIGKDEKIAVVGTGQNFIASHLSHIYNFRGPNMVIDTACSSSLTAIHLAVKSIRNNESEIALAGGVDILLDETPFLALSSAEILSPDGCCKPFNHEANGIGIGEGCGVLVLKSYKRALEDKNKIYGVIEGTAINNDGNTMGITTPNPEVQQKLIEAAIADANINPETITYVEAHGTGTLIGDPIELKALTSVLSKYSAKKQYCGVGSVKGNIGHLLSAAGAAGIIKVLLALAHEEIPPTLYCDRPNPRFNFDKSPLYLPGKVTRWTGDNNILRAGVSAFGLGGNNAHIILSNEGIPDSCKASLTPRGPKAVFNRKRYWPEKLHPDLTGDSNIDEFDEIFDIVEVRR